MARKTLTGSATESIRRSKILTESIEDRVTRMALENTNMAIEQIIEALKEMRR